MAKRVAALAQQVTHALESYDALREKHAGLHSTVNAVAASLGDLPTVEANYRAQLDILCSKLTEAVRHLDALKRGMSSGSTIAGEIAAAVMGSTCVLRHPATPSPAASTARPAVCRCPPRDVRRVARSSSLRPKRSKARGPASRSGWTPPASAITGTPPTR